MPKIKVIVDGRGMINAEGEDFNGPVCADRMRELLRNCTRVESYEKPEFTEQHTVEIHE